MDESKFKELIKKSELSTSKDFMDNLMSKIETEEKPIPPIHFPLLKPLIITGSILVLLGLLLLRFDVPTNLYINPVESLKYPIMIFSGAFLIWTVERYFSMKNKLPL